MIKKSHTPLKRLVRGTEILRRQASKRSKILSKYRESPIMSTLLKSGDAVKGRLFRSSDLLRDHKLLMATSEKPKKNWFMRFLDKVRDVLGNPDSYEMQRIRIRYEYDLAHRQVEEHYEL